MAKQQAKSRLYTIGFRDGSRFAVRAFSLADATSAVKRLQIEHARLMTADEAFEAAANGLEIVDGTSPAAANQADLPLAQ